jgi:Ca-activated chloride channel family protein
MKHIFLFLTILAMLALALVTTPAKADGIIIPEPPPCRPCPPPPCPGPDPCPRPSPMMQLAIRTHRVTVTIEDQVASTRVDQVFFNPNEWTVEGSYVFPLPANASVSSFTLWMDDKPVEGQILNAEEARQKYQEIVNNLRDPALLEYAGNGAVQAHIFPIPPQGERRITLEYTQVLPAENGLARYIYPLNTEKFSVWPLEEVTISVNLRARVPIRAVYSPSHNIEVSRENENHVIAGYEASQVTPDADFALYYSLGEQEALHLLSYRDAPDERDSDGFFLLMLAPRPQVEQEALPKDVLLVLDRSGSMEGDKFSQAQNALRFILKHLHGSDRFNVITFSTGLESYASELRPASETTEAIRWVEQMGAQGSTDINRALLEAASMTGEERPTYLIFLTDGLPTEGVVDSQDILENFAEAAPENLRLFAFGVGYDVDTFLLDSLAQAQHGASSYVLPEERLDETLSSFYTKISTPALTDLELDFGDIPMYDLYPYPLPDLFSGSQIILVGRYRLGGVTTIKLTGNVNQETRSFEFPEQIFASRSDFQYPLTTIPRLWATRKIGHLLNQIRLNGPTQETIDQIVRLSIRYGIVTPYTSYLVTEEQPLGESEQERIASEQYNQMLAMPAAPASGQGAVEKAVDQGSLEAAQAPASLGQESEKRIRIAGSRVFVFDGEQWIDTTFDPEKMTTTKVAFLSGEYYTLANSHPELASAFALGQAVIVVSEGVVYQVVDEDTPVDPTAIPPTYTPQTTTLPFDNVNPISTPVPRTTDKIAPSTTSIPFSPGATPCASVFSIPIILLAGYLVNRKHRC